MDTRFDVRHVEGRNSVMMEGGNLETSFNGVSGMNVPGVPSPRRRSLTQMTREALPRLDNYRNLMSVKASQRPTLGELHEGDEDDKEPIPEGAGEGGGGGHHFKLGWIQGVLIPVMLNIWGVMLFLRVSWIVGQAGIGLALIIVGVSAAVCTVTTLSLSAISTNGDVKGGGIYYIISRSLGPEFGASVGVVFAFANTVSASMNTIGFCDSLNELLRSSGYKIIDNSVNDTRIVGCAALVLMIIICAVGMEYEVKAQNVLVVIISGAILDYVIGVFIGPLSNDQLSKGFTGLNAKRYQENFAPDFRFSDGQYQNFFTVFSLFFTSVTGIQAGANISGDLKDPASAIPKGTLLAILITMISYVVFVLLVGGGELRDASGIISEVASGMFSNCTTRQCAYGLQNNFSVMQLMSIWWPFIYAGCFAATLSTALTNLLSVPRLIQALGYDQIYPGVIFFSKGYGEKGEPYRGYVLTLLVSAAFVIIADLNTIAPLVSNFYLAAYAFINFCTFHAAFMRPLGWRPSFKYYNKWLSLAGAIACIIIMFLIDWVMALVTDVIILALYLIVVYRKPTVNWGSSPQAQTYKSTMSAVYSLEASSDHVKNYRPQILVLSGPPSARPALVDLAGILTKNLALMVCGNISQDILTYRERSANQQNAMAWLNEHKVRGFYTLVDGLTYEEGTRVLLQASGIGKLKPNVLLMGYKHAWATCEHHQLIEYFDVLHDAFNNRMAVAILRLGGGLDYSSLAPSQGTMNHGMTRIDSDDCFVNLAYTEVEPPESPALSRYVVNSQQPQTALPFSQGKKKAASYLSLYRGPDGGALPSSIIDNLSVFQRKQPKGTLDVWWLYDDGGLTLLLPYIISTRKKWASCKLRIFALVNKMDELEVEERNMASLLSKFRVDYSSLTMVNNISDKPQPSSLQFFEQLIEPFRERVGAEKCGVTEAELKSLQSKTERQLRLRELLLQHSQNANMIVMTLPMPRKGMVSAPLYMAWLETLTKGMPPFLLVRGNQTSVLTFYS